MDDIINDTESGAISSGNNKFIIFGIVTVVVLVTIIGSVFLYISSSSTNQLADDNQNISSQTDDSEFQNSYDDENSNNNSYTDSNNQLLNEPINIPNSTISSLIGSDVVPNDSAYGLSIGDERLRGTLDSSINWKNLTNKSLPHSSIVGGEMLGESGFRYGYQYSISGIIAASINFYSAFMGSNKEIPQDFYAHSAINSGEDSIIKDRNYEPILRKFLGYYIGKSDLPDVIKVQLIAESDGIPEDIAYSTLYLKWIDGDWKVLTTDGRLRNFESFPFLDDEHIYVVMFEDLP